jgi:hypothetical protein
VTRPTHRRARPAQMNGAVPRRREDSCDGPRNAEAAALSRGRIAAEIRRLAAPGAASGKVGQGGRAQGHDAQRSPGTPPGRTERVEAELEEALRGAEGMCLR